MASPQVEKGYTKIANELIEAIYQTSFNATQIKILLFVIRYTYGFSRNQFKISASFLSKGTGISKRYISAELNKLIACNVIHVVRNYTVTESRIIEINKNIDLWQMSRSIVHQMNNTSPDDELFNTTDDELFNRGGEEVFSTTDEHVFNTTGEELFYQDKQNIKQNINKDVTVLFSDFWIAYPKKNAKASAQKAFTKLKVDGELLTSMLYALEIQKNSKQWQDITYVPYAATWLNQRRWEDEIEEQQSKVDFVQDGTMIQLR